MSDCSFEIKPFIYMLSVVLLISFCFDTTKETLKNPAYFFAVLCFAIVICTAYNRIKVEEIDAVYIIIAAGFFIKVLYVLYTAVWTRQHDVIDFSVGEGHAGYIEYIYFNKALPDGDPREKWAFFQPPLHHIIAALWMKVCNRFNLAYRQLQENIQALTLFYTGASTVISYFICRELRLKRAGSVIAMLIIAFHPVFIIMSGSINNDALSLMLMLLSFYLLLLWYKKPGFFLIILIALSLGLSMMAKLSGAMAAPAIAALFLYKLVRERKMALKLILQYLVFGVIVFPLGLFFEIRNMLLYGMPLNYIPPVGEQLEKTSLFSRFFDLRLNSIYPSMIANGDGYDEYNIFLAMLKTSLFDDAKLSSEWKLIDPFALVLFITGLILMLICFYSTFKVLVCKGRGALAFEYKLALSVFYFTMLFSYLAFAITNPNYSAQNFRYIAASVMIEAIFAGIYFGGLDKGMKDDEEEEGRGKHMFKVFALSALFALSSSLTYILLGFAR